MTLRRFTLAASLGFALLASAAPAAFAQGHNGDSNSQAAASGVNGGDVSTGGYSMAPDQPTTVAVGGDSNMMVPQPDLGRVPAGSGDGIFNTISVPDSPDMVVSDTAADGGYDAAATDGGYDAAAADGGYDAAATDGGYDASADGEAVYVPTCEDYGSWYEAQVALENSGDPALIDSLDPDYNGVACEYME